MQRNCSFIILVGGKMGLFKKTEYIEEIIPEISGNAGAMKVTMKNMPIRREALTSKLKLYSDFPSELIEEIYYSKNKFTYEDVTQVLQRVNKFAVNLKVKQLSEMLLEISGTLPKKQQFESDLSDAILNAWKSNNIKV
jgi:hypothetical protein